MATPTPETARAPDVTGRSGTAGGPSSGGAALPAAREATSATDSITHRKIRGAFFTPAALCDHIVTWALRDRDDSVLEPACGEAVFLLAAARRLRALDGVAGQRPDSHPGHQPGSRPGDHVGDHVCDDDHDGRSRGGGHAGDRGDKSSYGDKNSYGGEAVQPRGGRQGGLPHRAQLRGIELHAPTAAAAALAVTSSGEQAEITVADFFAVPARPDFDAVVGNPPYVRYQKFHGEARGRAQAAAGQAGVRLTSLASSWAAFTVHAARFLRPAGRLGLVLPAELLAVNYAAPVRQFLLERFRHVQLVLFTERVFPGVQEEVLLLLAEGTGPAGRFDVHQVRDLAELAATGAGHTAGPPGGTAPGAGGPLDGGQPT
ncbi:Eco57I restriction-modification methylase domain-containing protein, partial [Frankia sp. CiP1_Cm_nod1]